MKRGKDNGFSDKGGGPPGYVPLTLHQLGIGLTYYDEQRPSPPRGRSDNRRNDGNGRFDGNVASSHGGPQNGGQPGAEDSFDGAEPGPDDGLTQEAALDQMQQNRASGHQGGHQGGNNRRNHHGGGQGQGGGSRRSRHNGGGHNNRRGGGSHNGPMRGGIVNVGRRSRDDETLDGALERGNSAAERNGSRADRGHSEVNGNTAHSDTAHGEPHSGNGANGGWQGSGGESEE